MPRGPLRSPNPASQSRETASGVGSTARDSRESVQGRSWPVGQTLLGHRPSPPPGPCASHQSAVPPASELSVTSGYHLHPPLPGSVALPAPLICTSCLLYTDHGQDHLQLPGSSRPFCVCSSVLLPGTPLLHTASVLGGIVTLKIGLTLTPGACRCDFIWKQGLCKHSEVRIKEVSPD